MAGRQLLAASVRDKTEEFYLGYVADPLPGHERYRGMLAIPYLRPTDDPPFAASIRFRCIEPDCEHMGHGKYNTVSGDKPRMFNTIALLTANDQIAVCEGELDAITAEACGIHAVGFPGATTWKPEFRPPFLGYETVWVLSDGDKAGDQFADRILKELPNARHIPMPSGQDVNSLVVSEGKRALIERMK